MHTLVKALRLLIVNYFKVVPYYIVYFIILVVVSGLIPFIGWMLALPLMVGITYKFVDVILNKNSGFRINFFLGYSEGRFGRSIMVLSLRHIIIIFLTTSFSFFIFRVLSEPLSYLIANTTLSWVGGLTIGVFIALLPAMIISMLLSMVPFLLADPQLGTMVKNHFATSVRMLKGHYLKLFGLRFIFQLWYVWLFVGMIFIVLWISVLLWGAPNWPFEYEDFEQFLTIYWVSLLAHPIIVMPLERMIHAVVYSDLRQSLLNKDQR